LPAASASVRFVGIDQIMKAGPDGRLTLKLDPDIGGLVDRHHLALHLGYVGSSLLITNPRKSGCQCLIDNNERSNRGAAGGIIGDFLSIGKVLAGKEAEIGELPRTRAESRP
jgi:hypothetical protein